MQRYRLFADGAKARGMRTLLTVTGTAATMATPGEYAAVVADIATELRGKGVDYEVWNEQDDTGFWLNGPQPAAYTALLKAAYPAIKNADPAATVVVGGLVANDFEFVEQLYNHGAKGSFDAVGVHTDTACLTTDPREYYREPSGRIGRYAFTGYREVRATMLAHGDDKPVWMTELGWPTITSTCERGGRAGTKAAGVTPAQQADFLDKAYGCLAADPYVHLGSWFSLSDVQTGSTNDALNLGLMTDSFARKPAFAAFQGAASAAPIACGGTLDSGAPVVTMHAPTDGAKYLTSLPIHVTATDSEGVNDIDLKVDGKEVPLKTVKSGNSASVKFEWGGAKKLSFGPHTIVAIGPRRSQERGPRRGQGHPRGRRQLPLQGQDRVRADRRQGQGRQGQGPRQDHARRATSPASRTVAPTSSSPASTPRPSAGRRSPATRATPSTRSRSATSSRSAACGASPASSSPRRASRPHARRPRG